KSALSIRAAKSEPGVPIDTGNSEDADGGTD
ncbi:MAG: hypothetical protein CFH04_02180, partial [Alphaproteobacteria bacterium MarineAlpha3_Bin3]